MTRADILNFPRAPGVYLMKDARGAVLYVGKARSLRARVLQYFAKRVDSRAHIVLMLQQVAAIDTIVTATEIEALLLEYSLIRKHRPRYNIIFRDDKSYVSVKVNVAHASPGIFRTRRIVKDGAKYFGPYPHGLACRETMETVTRYFGIRTCSDREFANRSRPCLQYQIGLCSAPCVGKIRAEEYQQRVAHALLFLQGKHHELVRALTQEMRVLAGREQFEAAAAVRNRLRDIAQTRETQRVIAHHGDDADYVAWATVDDVGAVAVLEVRGGAVVERGGATVDVSDDDSAAQLASFLLQYYRPPRAIPAKIFVAKMAGDLTLVGAILAQHAAPGNVRILAATRGTRATLIALAAENARALCEHALTHNTAWAQIAQRLQRELNLAVPPRVIECVDNSHWQGTEPVSALVAFANGVPAKSRYRLFKLREGNAQNDYAMMHEVLTRRLCGLEKTPLPDFLLIDGGRGQLAVAVKVASELGLRDLSMVAIAKAQAHEPADKIYLPGRVNPVNLKPKEPAQLFLQRVRDEVHRFVLQFHRKRRESV